MSERTPRWRTLAEAARWAAGNAASAGLATGPHLCSRWCRELVGLYLREHGDPRGREWAPYGVWGASANQTGSLLQGAGYAVPTAGIRAGDLVVWRYAPHGHIEVVVEARPTGVLLVAGNCTGCPGRTHRSVGMRLVGTGGSGIASRAAIAVVGRLPVPGVVQPPAPPRDTYELRLSGVVIATMPVIGGAAHVPAHVWARALGLELGWEEETRRITLEGRVVPVPTEILEEGGLGRAYVPIRPLVEWHGDLVMAVDTTARVVQVTRGGRLAA